MDFAPFYGDFFGLKDEFANAHAVDHAECEKYQIQANEDDSQNCPLCREKYKFLTRRKTRCSFCGIFYCNSCVENKVASGNETKNKVCDACATFVCAQQSKKLSGLRVWAEGTIGSSIFESSPKITAISFFNCLVSNTNKIFHPRAIYTLNKIFQTENSLALINATTAPRALFCHSMQCDCEMKGHSLDLFLDIFLADQKSCRIAFDRPPFSSFDFHSFFKTSDISTVRSGARCLLILSGFSKIDVMEDSAILKLIESEDPIVSAFISASLLKAFCNSEACKNEQAIIEIVFRFMKQKNPSYASIYYLLQVLLIIAKTDAGCDLILQNNYQVLPDISRLFYSDKNLVSKGSMIISSNIMQLFNILWDYSNQHQNKVSYHSCLFPLLIMPIFEILLIPILSTPQKFICDLMKHTLELVQHISSHSDYGESVKKPEIIGSIKEIQSSDEELQNIAKLTVSSLENAV